MGPVSYLREPLKGGTRFQSITILSVYKLPVLQEQLIYQTSECFYDKEQISPEKRTYQMLVYIGLSSHLNNLSEERI